MLYYCVKSVVVGGGLYSFGNSMATLIFFYMSFWTICNKDGFLGLISSVTNSLFLIYVDDLYEEITSNDKLIADDMSFILYQTWT